MDEKTVNVRKVFDGRLIRVEVVDVELEDGARAVREIVRHPGAAAVVARVPDGRFLFVRQFRKPVEDHLVEIVAGTLDGGEDPAACARREVAEETGHGVARLEPLGTIYPSPGYVDEAIHVFFAEVAEGGPVLEGDHDERIDCVLLERPEFEAMIRSGRVRDSKTLAAWLLFEKSGIGREGGGA